MANTTGEKFGGRKKGTPNKLTAELRQKINDFLNDNWNCLQKDFERLEPKDKLNFYEKLLQNGLPRLQSTQYNIKPDWEEHKKTIKSLFPSDEELQEAKESEN